MWNTFCWKLWVRGEAGCSLKYFFLSKGEVRIYRMFCWHDPAWNQAKIFNLANIWNILHLTKMNTFIQTLWLKWTNINFQVNTNPLLKHTVALSVVGKISQQSIIKGLTIFMFPSILSWIKWPTNGNVKMFLYPWLFFRTIHRDLRG